MEEPNDGSGEQREVSGPSSQDKPATSVVGGQPAENTDDKINVQQSSVSQTQAAAEGVIDDTFAYMRAQNVTINDAQPIPGEPAKIDITAASIEPAAVRHLGGTFTPASKTDDSMGAQETISTPAPDLAPNVLAIDNPHPVAPQIHKGIPSTVVVILLMIVGAAIGFVGSAASGYSFREAEVKTVTQSVPAEAKELVLPEDATLLNACVPGRGKQYIQQAKAPTGPVYNVHNDKIVGLEYKLNQKQLQTNKPYLNLMLEEVAYDHAEVNFIPKGDTSLTEPYYRVNVFTVSADQIAKITCE